MTYEEAVRYLEKSYSLDKCSFTENFKLILERLNNPHKKLNFIHIAGTNGKGSTTAMLSSVLIEQGYKTGTFTSPHLEEFTERIAINGEQITKEDFASLIGEVEAAGRDLPQPALAFFHILTAVCFLYFVKKEVDIAIIETGLGGRLDCTNIIEKPLLSAITSIGYDHMQFLGNTIEDIAWQKAGIIKKDCPVVMYGNSEKVNNVIHKEAEEKNAPIYSLGNEYKLDLVSAKPQQTIFDIECPFFKYKGLAIHLMGTFQVYNACTVLLCVEALRKQGYKITDGSVYNGLKAARWPGRMEVVSEKPTVILDGCHNTDAIHRFCESIKEYFPDKRHIFVVGISDDKEYSQMLGELSSVAGAIILTQPPNHRFIACEKMAEHVTTQCYIKEDYQEAIQFALDLISNDDIISIIGSLYLIGEIKTLIGKGGWSDDRFQRRNKQV